MSRTITTQQFIKQITKELKAKGLTVSVTLHRRAKASTHEICLYTFPNGWSCKKPFTRSANDHFAAKQTARQVIRHYNLEN